MSKRFPEIKQTSAQQIKGLQYVDDGFDNTEIGAVGDYDDGYGFIYYDEIPDKYDEEVTETV